MNDDESKTKPEEQETHGHVEAENVTEEILAEEVALTEEELLAQDRGLSFNVLNYINSIYQGEIVSLNIYSQLEEPSKYQDKIEAVQQTLDQIRLWTDELLGGKIFISAEWQGPKTEDAKRAWGLMAEIRPDLQLISREIKDINSSGAEELPKESQIKLVAAYGRYAYSRDNFIRGCINYASKFGNEDTLTEHKVKLLEIGEDLKVANMFVETLMKEEAPSSGFLYHLKMESLDLPGAFRGQALDILLRIHGYRPVITYEDLGFLQLEETVWRTAKILPVDAGYWRAYELGADEAQRWINIGMPDPVIASKWKSFGFHPEDAAGWIDIIFTPFMAREWSNHGFTAELAADFVAKGILTPQDAKDLTPRE